ncbi:hypothetical protein [Cupriavidus necator]|uniref:hypothetical protein n=1 Tax=Cupriavidus necator TaxID=106590 RepID=UPI000A95E858|nr:hypothetical protein [Cupriavidus necator]
MIQATAVRAALAAVPWRPLAWFAAGAFFFCAGWTAQGWRKDAELAELTSARAQADLTSATVALADLQEAGAAIRARANEYNSIQTTLGAKLDAIRKDIKNATPLPVDCRPDDYRVRKLSDAVDAAKQAASTR